MAGGGDAGGDEARGDARVEDGFGDGALAANVAGGEGADVEGGDAVDGDDVGVEEGRGGALEEGEGKEWTANHLFCSRCRRDERVCVLGMGMGGGSRSS